MKPQRNLGFEKQVKRHEGTRCGEEKHTWMGMARNTTKSY